MKKWLIVYDNDNETEAHAVRFLRKDMTEKLYYEVPIKSVKKLTPADGVDFNLFFVGTAKTNALVESFLNEHSLSLPDNEQGYAFKVTPTDESGVQTACIAGCSPAGVLHGAVDFINTYLSHDIYFQHKYRVTESACYDAPVKDGFPATEKISYPSVKERGIWTWGHVIYDYKGFFDNMARLRFNVIIIWNDHAPVNAKEVVNYAHSLGIKVIWGYTWGWENNEDFPSPTEENAKLWAERVFKVYEDEYADTGADGIYFQTFTETTNDTFEGKRISQAVVKWVNIISEKLYAKYPDLRIQFGLHAISVNKHLDDIADVDERMEIVWEDCGAFPYSYYPDEVEPHDETVEFSKKIANLRGKNDKFGVVTKNMCLLDWLNFEHPYEVTVLGEKNEAVINRMWPSRQKIWRFFQKYWLENADYAYDVIKTLREAKNGNLLITALVENGLFERGIFFPVALYSAMLWDTNTTSKELIKEVMKWDCTYFANV